MAVFHHMSKRRRAMRLEPFPHPRFSVRFIDGAATVAGIIGPLMAIPQLLRIYVEHSAAGVAPLSWFSWAVLDIPFIMYGIMHKDRLIITTYTSWFFLNLLVAVGAVLYG